MTTSGNTRTLAASILAADYSKLGAQIECVACAGVTWIHVDVMDGAYVPFISFGAGIVALVKRHAPTCVCDVHLMVERPERQIDAVLDAGADYVSFHPETTRRAQYCVSTIHAKGAKACLALSPGVPLVAAQPLLEQLDMLLIMTVEPGFGGQPLLEGMLAKITAARTELDLSGNDARLEVDGGVDLTTMSRLAQAGADTFAVGSSLFGASDINSTLAQMNGLLTV